MKHGSYLCIDWACTHTILWVSSIRIDNKKLKFVESKSEKGQKKNGKLQKLYKFSNRLYQKLGQGYS